MWFRKKPLSGDQAAALSEQGWAALGQQDLEAALKHFQALAKALPEDPRWMNGVGAVSLARQDEADARRHFRMAAERDYPGSHYNLGVMAYREEDHDAAMEHLERAARQDYPLALNLIGDIQLHAERYVQAEQAYRRAAELGHADGYNNLGLLYLQTEAYSQAKEALLQALQSDHVYAKHNLAVAYHRLGELEAAERWYLISFTQHGNLQSLENLGHVYADTGREAQGQALVSASDKLYEDRPLNDYEQATLDRLLA